MITLIEDWFGLRHEDMHALSAIFLFSIGLEFAGISGTTIST